MTLTTDEMDKTTPEERYKLVALCTKCGEWHFFEGSKDRFLQTHNEVCECGGKSFTELRSQRTWNPQWAKQVASKVKRKIKKNP